MRYYSVSCEAPGGLGPTAVYRYDSTNSYIEEIEYLDLEFEVWLGGELVQDVQCYCVTVPLWEFLESNKITGVSVRKMTVTPGEHVNDLDPGRVIPEFVELVLPRTAKGRRGTAWVLEKARIPSAEMFTGSGLPLFVTERIRDLLLSYNPTSLEFEEAVVREA